VITQPIAVLSMINPEVLALCEHKPYPLIWILVNDAIGLAGRAFKEQL